MNLQLLPVVGLWAALKVATVEPLYGYACRVSAPLLNMRRRRKTPISFRVKCPFHIALSTPNWIRHR